MERMHAAIDRQQRCKQISSAISHQHATLEGLLEVGVFYADRAEDI
jgi:hypothetical protein